MKPPIKLLIFAKDIDGGIGTFLFNVLKIKPLFLRNTIEIKTIVLEKPDYSMFSTNDILFLKPRLYEQKFSFSPQELTEFLKDFLWFKKHVALFKPDIVLSIDVNCNLIAEITKMLHFTKFKTIFTTHVDVKATIQQKATVPLRLILAYLVHIFYNRADVLVCASKDLAKSLTSDFRLRKRIHAIYNGRLLPAKKYALAKSKKNVILSIARLDEQKDHRTLLHAFALLQPVLPNSQLWLASDGPLRSELEKLARDLKISKKVRFLGWVDNIFTLIRKADIFVLSSRREGFSYALVEAMSQGKAVVATDTPHGPSEILGRGRYGMLVPMGDAMSLKEAVLSLLQSTQKYKRFATLACLRSRAFPQEAMLRRYKHLILSLRRER